MWHTITEYGACSTLAEAVSEILAEIDDYELGAIASREAGPAYDGSAARQDGWGYTFKWPLDV